MSFINIAYAKTITSIEITGLNTISRGTILSYIPIEVGDTIDKNTSNQIIRTLHKTNLFADVSVLIDQGIIKIHLREKPHIYNIEIKGYSDAVIEAEQLKRLLESVRLTRGEIFNQRTLNRLTSELERNYQENGYYLAKINTNVELDNKNRVSIVVNITENHVVRVRSMRITGAKIYKEAELLDEFEIGTPDFFLINYFTEKDQYSRKKLDLGLKKIATIYKNDGYIDFNVDQVIADITADKKYVDIHINIFEGQPYKVDKIILSGDITSYSSKDVDAQLTFKSGDIFNQKELAKSAQNIANHYTKKGYAFIDVTPITSQNPSAKTIDIEIPVRLNQRVYVNRIIIRGNAITQDEVVRRELVQAEGSLYSSESVQKSINNLKRLGYFSDVSMQVERIVGSSDKINLIFTVTETKTGNFTIGLSHTKGTGLSTNLGVSEKNFLGTGNTFVIDFVQNNAIRRYAFSFIDPHFNDQGHSINYGFSFNKLDASEVGISEYQINTSSIHLGYGVPIGEYIRTNATLYLANHDIVCGKDFINLLEREESPSLKKQCEQKRESRLNLSWSKNTLNSFRNPSKGEKINFGLNFALPTGDFQYIKADLKHDMYSEISKNLVLKLDYKVGLAQGIGDEELPFFRRYFAGGEHTVRGFTFNTLGDKYSTDKAKGGEISLIGRVALITPVPFVKDSSAMRLNAFVDTGSIYKDLPDVDIRDMRVATGLGFNWITPLGPITISYATPINRKTSDGIDKFSFSLGSYF